MPSAGCFSPLGALKHQNQSFRLPSFQRGIAPARRKAVTARRAFQAGIAHGPQQVNNGVVPSRAEENRNAPNKLLEQSNEIPMDTGAPGATVGSDSSMATVDEIDGT
jgi:hypothetical protein